MPLPEEGVPEGALYDTPPAFDPHNLSTDPEPVQPTSGPARSSTDAPGFGDTSGADGEQPSEAPQGQQTEQEPEPLPEFDERYRIPFEGLLYLGRLQDRFTLWHHEFVVRTLTTEEMAEIALIVKPYQGTNVVNAVYQAACVAAAVVTVDGQPLPGSIEVDDSDVLTNVRFPYIMRKWMPPVREAVYNKMFELELVSREVLEEMGKALG